MSPIDSNAATETLSGRHQALDLAPGTLLAGRFRIESLLGIGGMGVVYRARDLTLDIEVALKLLRPELAARPQAFERFRRELLLARQVSSPQVVRIHDIAEHDGLCFISMDLIEGEALDKRLDREGALPVPTAIAIALQIAQGLAAAHAVGVVHRDLKPANVLVDPQGQVRIADFGVARSLGTGGSTAGSIVGTPEYLSPEQARGEVADARSDLYALGLILYEMLSGQLPFAGLTAAESLSQRMWRTPVAITQHRADVPVWLQRLLERLLQPKPGHRLASADAVLTALHSQHMARDWRPLARKSSVLALAAAVVAGLWLGWHPQTPAPPALPIPDRLVLLPIVAPDADESLRVALPAAEEWLRQALRELPDTVVVSAERTRLALSQTRLEGSAAVADAALLKVLPARRVVALSLSQEGNGLRLRAEVRQGGHAPQAITADAAADNLGDATADLLDALRRQWAPTAPAIAASAPSDPLLRDCGQGLQQRAHGELEAALASFERCAQQSVASPLGWSLLSETADLAGHAGLAQTAVQQGLEHSSGSDELRLWRSWLDGNDDAALTTLQTRLQMRVDDLDEQLRLARWQAEAGRLDAAEHSLQALLARDEQDPRAWFLRGKTAILRGEPRLAVEDHLLRALVLFKRSRDRFGEAETTNALGVGYARLGQSADAEEHYRKAVELRRALGNRRGIASSLRNLGQMALVGGRFDEAQSSFAEARTLFEALQDADGVAAIDNELGMLAEERGDYRQALQAYRAALRGREAGGDAQGIAESLNNIGYAHYQLGAYDSARVFWQQALDAFARSDDGNGRLRAQQNLGLLAIAEGDWPRAEQLLGDTLREAETHSLLEEAAVSLRNLAELDLLRARLDSAQARIQRARALFDARGDRRGLIDADLLHLRWLLARGDSASVPSQLAELDRSIAEASFEQQALLALAQAEWARVSNDQEAVVAALETATTAADRAGIVALDLRLRMLALEPGQREAEQALEAALQQLDNLPLRLRWVHRRLELAASPAAVAAVYRQSLPLLQRFPEALDSLRSHRLASDRLDADAAPELLAQARRALAAGTAQPDAGPASEQQ